MATFFSNLRNTVIAGFVIALIVLGIHWGQVGVTINDQTFWMFVMRWGHIISGVMWIGLLWYFNFVSTPTTPSIPQELRPALGKYITPAALFWFRWSAMGTIIFGIILAWLNGYLIQAYTLDSTEGFATPSYLMIGIGMWFGTIMWFNVWFIIWPNQQKVMGTTPATPDEVNAARRTAGLASRVNTLLSIPMLYAMVFAGHYY